MGVYVQSGSRMLKQEVDVGSGSGNWNWEDEKESGNESKGSKKLCVCGKIERTVQAVHTLIDMIDQA